MIELNFFIHGIAFSQILRWGVLSYFSKTKKKPRLSLIFLSFLMCIFILKPIFLFYNLKLASFFSIFLSCFIPYVCYIFASSLFQETFKLSKYHYILFFMNVLVSSVLIWSLLYTNKTNDYYWIISIFLFYQMYLSFHQAITNWNDDLIEERILLRKLFVIFISIYSIFAILFYSEERNSLESFQSLAHALYLIALSTSFNIHYFFDGHRVFPSLEKKRSSLIPIFNKNQLQHIDKILKKTMTEEKLFVNKTLNMNELSKHTKIKPKELRYFINNNLGYRNFQDFLNNLRLKEVKRLLQDPTHTHEKIQRLSTAAGFTSSTSFNRIFKQKENVSPSEYRKKFQKKM